MTEQHPRAVEVGQFLRERRLELGMKQSDLALANGPSKPTVGQWERGNIPALPNLGTLIAFDTALKLDNGTLRRLLEGETKQPAPQQQSFVSEVTLNDLIRELGTIMTDTWSFHTGVRNAAELPPELEQLGDRVVARSADLFRKLIEQASPPTDEQPEAGTSGSHRAPGVPSRRG